MSVLIHELRGAELALRMAVFAALLLAVFSSDRAWAGPPFRTDDPDTVSPGHWEINNFSAMTSSGKDFSGNLFGIDANYGAARDIQINVTPRLAFDSPRGSATQVGIGDTGFGLKYRFLHEDKDGWRPMAGIYPEIVLPTGNARSNLGTGFTHIFLPLWVQKSVGKWTTFGGGGYWINPGTGNRNYWYLGWAITRQISKDLTVGGELFHQTSDIIAGHDQAGFDIGLIYDMTKHTHLLFSVGTGLYNRNGTNQFSYYTALQLTF